MEEVYKQRLLKLADFLDTLPPYRFNYSYWVGSNWGGKSDLSCNTTACALGWATTIPEFQALGLCLVKANDYHNSHVAMVDRASNAFADSNKEAEFAGYTVFGLNRSQFTWLFFPGYGYNKPNSYASAREVAKHIRAFVTDPDVCSTNGEDYQDGILVARPHVGEYHLFLSSVSRVSKMKELPKCLRRTSLTLRWLMSPK